MGHGGAAGMSMDSMVRDMRNRFLVAATFSVPILLWSPIGRNVLGFTVAAPFGLRDDVWLLLLSLPVIFYSSWIFFDGAVAALLATGVSLAARLPLPASPKGGLRRRQRAARAHLHDDRRHPRPAVRPGRRGAGRLPSPVPRSRDRPIPMLHQTPPTWAHLLPGYGGFRILTNAVLTPGFPQTDPLLIALARLAAVTAAAGLPFRHNMQVASVSAPLLLPPRGI